jgi:hypothetical protein
MTDLRRSKRSVSTRKLSAVCLCCRLSPSNHLTKNARELCDPRPRLLERWESNTGPRSSAFKFAAFFASIEELRHPLYESLPGFLAFFC